MVTSPVRRGRWRVPVLLLAWLPLLPVVGSGADEVDARDLVRRAARFVARQAQDADEGRGVRFPEYAEVPDEVSDTLYDGGAGVLVFLENAAVALQDPELAALADRSAAALEARLDGAPTTLRCGLYDGLAGVGQAFLVRHRLRGDETSLSLARRVGDHLRAGLRTAGRTASWDERYDVIAGAAGAAIFLVELGEATGEEGYGDAAGAVGRWLAAQGLPSRTADGRAERRWPPAFGETRHYPNFSHGTAGVAYALARIHALTGDVDCLTASLEGATWLVEHGRREEGTLALCHFEPGAEDRYREGWCHGPVGTGRLFLLLGGITGSATWTQHALEQAAWVQREKPIVGLQEGSVRFYSPSLCCGAAGVLDFFVDLARVTRRPDHVAYAQAVGAYLARLAKPDDEGDGLRWTNYDRPDEKGLVYHGVSLMLGASGEGLALLRLATLDVEPDPVASLGDRVVGVAGARPPEPQHPTHGVRVELPQSAHGGEGYVVLVPDGPATDVYHEAARALAAWRGGTVVEGFDPQRPEEVTPRLRELGARYVALVLPPEAIDVNVQRRFLMAAARLDDDPFVDVAWGFVTGTPRTPPTALVERAKWLEETGLARRWVGASVASSIESTVYPGAGNPTAAAAGWEGRHVYFGSREADPDVLDFVERELAQIEGGGVVSFSGCGDPEGTWLFSDRRNADPAKHWPFDSAKVGQDPDGTMPRITADRFAKLDLGGSVVLTGVCHAGALSRVFVEGDIVSTFGTAEGHPVYRIPDGRSVAGAILDAGAAAYVAPLGPNHGYRTLMEVQEAFERGLSLGEMLASTWNDVAMAQGRAPVLDLYAEGGDAVDRDPGEVMGGGGANRVLYGDPALSPFAGQGVEPAVRPLVRSSGERSRVVEAHVAQKDWWSWDMFARDRNTQRIRTIVDLPAGVQGPLRVTAQAWDAAGRPVEIGRLDARVEARGSVRRLHLQVAAARGAGLDAVGARAHFVVAW